MKTYHLDINSPISCEKYWLYYEDDSECILNTILFTDSYAKVRMMMDLYGLKANSIKIYRDDFFQDYPRTHKINCVFVELKKYEK